MPPATNKKKLKGAAAKAAKALQKAISKTKREQGKANKKVKDWEEHNKNVMEELVELYQLQEEPVQAIIDRWRQRLIEQAKEFGLEGDHGETLLDDDGLIAWLINSRDKEIQRCAKAIRHNQQVSKWWKGEEMVLTGAVSINPFEKPADPPVEDVFPVDVFPGVI